MKRTEARKARLVQSHARLRTETWSDQVWVEENRDHRRRYMADWHRRNQENATAARLRRLRPEQSLFTVFEPMSYFADAVDCRTPLDELMEKEERLAA